MTNKSSIMKLIRKDVLSQRDCLSLFNFVCHSLEATATYFTLCCLELELLWFNSYSRRPSSLIYHHRSLPHASEICPIQRMFFALKVLGCFVGALKVNKYS